MAARKRSKPPATRKTLVDSEGFAIARIAKKAQLAITEAQLRNMASAYSGLAMQTYIDVLQDTGSTTKDKITAADRILNRVYGLPKEIISLENKQEFNFISAIMDVEKTFKNIKPTVMGSVVETVKNDIVETDCVIEPDEKAHIGAVDGVLDSSGDIKTVGDTVEGNVDCNVGGDVSGDVSGIVDCTVSDTVKGAVNKVDIMCPADETGNMFIDNCKELSRPVLKDTVINRMERNNKKLKELIDNAV